MLIVLAVLVAAYIVYRMAVSDGFGIPELDFDRINLTGFRKAGAVVPYVATVLIGILTQVVKRARSARKRRELEERAAREGVLGSEKNVSWRPVSSDGKRGKRRKGRLVLTRAAVYLMDSSSGDATRLAIMSPEPGAPTVTGATTRREPNAVMIELKLTGGDGGSVLLNVSDTTAWVALLTKALGRRIEAEPAEPPAVGRPGEDASENDDDDDDDEAGWMSALGI
ncbi:MAG: hypothetical protein GF405_10825 [Candidatus Eisenbacteria bacterium]|nr:hypothetical protein [Candidatus Eisenbacteria bacterium]